MNIVLLEPEIPLNTGNIGRTCVATDAKLHLIRPLGFDIDDKALKRAGLDYWKDLDVTVYDDYVDFLQKQQPSRIYMATTKAKKVYSDVTFQRDDYILFGKESKGIPEILLKENYEHCIRIPMFGKYRSLNLSNAVAIVLYEAYRQIGFENLEFYGELHQLTSDLNE